MAQMTGGGRVDGHRGGDVGEREAVEQDLHVLQRGDGDAALAELAEGLGGVGVVAVERGHVEGDREAGVALREQVLEAGVGLLGGAEAGEHAHRPELAAVAGGVDAAGEGVLAGVSDGLRVVSRAVRALDRAAGGGHEGVWALGCAVLSAVRGARRALGGICLAHGESIGRIARQSWRVFCQLARIGEFSIANVDNLC